MIHMDRLAISVMAHSPFTPLANSLLPTFPLLTWNPSFCVVLSCPPWSQVTCKLTSPSPSLPIPNSHHPRSIVRPTKTTSRSRLHMVRNNNYPSILGGEIACLFCRTLTSIRQRTLSPKSNNDVSLLS
jgi:hypothetical protein